MDNTVTYKILVAYDGTAYAGWQVQPDQKTLAGTLEKTFKRIFGVACVILGASRTDTGVHALGQVFRLTTTLHLEPSRLLKAWQLSLPSDIVLRSAEIAPGFHPQHDVERKEYWYHLFIKRPLPFIARFGWYPERFLPTFNEDVFKKAMSLFVGTHNFSAFSKVQEGKNPVRTVMKITISYDSQYGWYRIRLVGDGFLHYQIRRMVGAAFTIATHSNLDVTLIADLLARPGNSEYALGKADSLGLCLRRIVYKV